LALGTFGEWFPSVSKFIDDLVNEKSKMRPGVETHQEPRT